MILTLATGTPPLFKNYKTHYKTGSVDIQVYMPEDRIKARIEGDPGAMPVVERFAETSSARGRRISRGFA